MFSATFSPDIARLAKNFLKPDPFMIEVARQNQTADTVTQEVFQVADREKTDVLIDILKTRGPENKPLEQVIDTLKEQMRTRHILRMQQGHCSIEAGFVLSDLLTDLERTSDHCSNIAGCVIDARAHNLNLHETLRQAKTADGSFQQTYESYVEKYQLPVPSSNV